jgi:trimeric autotransporter adhesin
MSQAGGLNNNGGGGGGANVQTLTGNTGGAVPATANNINVVGSGSITVTGTPLSSTLTITSSAVTGVSSVTGTANQILASPTTGNVVLSLIGPYTPATYTAHGVLIGEGTGSIVAVAPDATSGIPLISQGSTSDPAYGTALVAGGGTGSTSFNTTGVVISGATSTTALSALTLTDGQVVIGSSAGAPAAASLTAGTGITITPGHNSISIAATGAGSISTIDGDTGSATGSTITFNANSNAGKSVFFAASSATVDLTVTDSNSNTYVGLGAGTAFGTNNVGLGRGVFAAVNTNSSEFCTGLGTFALQKLTTGSNNTAIGNQALQQLLTGSNNIVIGEAAGSSYISAESSNICIGSGGSGSESNVIRIGTQGSSSGQQNTCFIAGIIANTVSNAELVTINSSTGQLGVTSATSTFAYTNVNHAASPYTVLTTDYYLSVDCSGGAVTLDFPNAPTAKQTWIVKDRTGSASTNNISITTPGGIVTFDGQTTYKITSNYGAINLLANATPTYEVY